MDKRQIEFVEPGGVKLGKMHYMPGDTVSLDKDIADMCVRQGWAKCVATGEIGERKAGAVKIDVQNISQRMG